MRSSTRLKDLLPEIVNQLQAHEWLAHDFSHDRHNRRRRLQSTFPMQYPEERAFLGRHLGKHFIMANDD